jgi:hypothetical protein
MIAEIIFMPRKRRQLIERNRQLSKEIKKFKLKESCLSPNRDTAAEIAHIDGMKREIRFNRRLMNTLFASYLLSLIGVYPKI